ncbi:hypothetical protein ACFWBN_38815 [Streptomyces sp. NPDC059989]|uniref:hypothetical protein n=1 Tax=Streptomyces sp. NPDC059989 TaxID=3347026 RepID=UPI0036864D0B
MPTSPDRAPRHRAPRWAAFLCMGGLITSGALFMRYLHDRPHGLGKHREQLLQFSGQREEACRAVYELGRRCEATGARIDAFRHAISADSHWLIPSYALALMSLFGLGVLFLYRLASRRFAFRAMLLTPVAAAADLAENAFLRSALQHMADDPDYELLAAASFALLKWSLVAPLFIIAGWVLLTLLARYFTKRSKLRLAPKAPVLPGSPGIARRMARTRAGEGVRGTAFAVGFWALLIIRRIRRHGPRLPVRFAHRLAHDPGHRPCDPQIIVPPAAPHRSSPLEDWTAPPSEAAPPESAHRRWRSRSLPLPGREAAEIGICVSGGGIRSASVTLGALQALREAGVLTKARYLVSVSGGGFTAGAFQLALTTRQPRDRRPQPPPRADLATPQDVFAPGSPEEHHLRRHAKYLADSPQEFVRALGAALRGVLVSLTLLALTFTVAGIALNEFYSLVPVIEIERFRPGGFDPTSASGTATGVRNLLLPRYAWLPIVGLVAVAGAVSLAASLFRPRTGAGWPRWLRLSVKGIVWMAVGIAVYALLIPLVLWFFAWLVQRQNLFPEGTQGVTLLAGLTAALTWLGAMFTALYQQVKKIRPDGEKAGWLSAGATSLVTKVGTGWLQYLVVWVVLLVLGFVGLAVLSWSTVLSDRWHWGWRLGLPAALLVLAVVLDQTMCSLHPFYRQRLASAFAVRRAVLWDGSVGALPYDYHAELTRLSTHAERVKPFPQVIFAAAAALSSRNRTAPGRPAVPFTFASDYVGGPDVGWVKTSTLEKTSHPLIQRDLTVQSAVAVSGAAFASTMGTQSKAVQRLLALSNLRLGTWLPNPLYLAEVAKFAPDWTMPRLPRMRRLRYQLQELIGLYSDTSPMLLCTDGGHIDNLGLVELLRLRCRKIYVIDSSGDVPPLATTLAQAIALAYEDLGVEISFDLPDQNMLTLVPGSAEKLSPEDPMSALNARLSARCVVRGTIRYPEPVEFTPGEPGTREGTIVFAKASLTTDMPYELLSYALTEKVFPRQSTFDQSFDHDQFDAYLALGRHLGAAAAGSRPVKRVQPNLSLRPDH